MTETEKAVRAEREACARIIERINVAWTGGMSTREAVTFVKKELANIVRNRPAYEEFAAICQSVNGRRTMSGEGER